jgi:hypothetical protein
VVLVCVRRQTSVEGDHHEVRFVTGPLQRITFPTKCGSAEQERPFFGGLEPDFLVHHVFIHTQVVHEVLQVRNVTG